MNLSKEEGCWGTPWSGHPVNRKWVTFRGGTSGWDNCEVHNSRSHDCHVSVMCMSCDRGMKLVTHIDQSELPDFALSIELISLQGH